MKTWIIILLSCSLTVGVTNLYGQFGGSTLVTVSGGFAFPLGDFSSTDADNEEAGYAQSGANFNLNGYYMLGNKIGLGGMLTGCTNTINTAGYQENFEQEYPGLENWVVTAQKWAAGGIMASAMANLEVTGNLLAQFRLGMGPVMVFYPEIEVSAITETDYFVSKCEGNKTTTFGIDGGASLLFRLGYHKYLTVNGDYLFANASFNDLKTIVWLDPDEAPEETTRSLNQSVQYINISFGLAFFFE